MFVSRKRFNQLDRQVDAIAEHLHKQTEHEFEPRQRPSFTIFGPDMVTKHELTLRGKIDLIVDHLGLNLEVKEPEEEPSVKVTKKKGKK